MGKLTVYLLVTVYFAVQENLPVSGQSLRAGGLHVCSRRYTYNTYYTAPAQRIAYDNYRTCCKKVWGVCIKRCTRYRTRLVTYYVSKLRVNHGTSYYCCSGWARRGNECPVAICRPPCQNGYCIAPNKCHCRSGFAGKYCQIDINECLKSPCQQICRNLRGTYSCSCRRGFRKVSSTPTDGRCQNINECASSSKLCSCAVGGGSCKAICLDTIGSYRCQCSNGYQLVNSKICRDIDECKTGGHGCQHKCVNQLGGFQCSCNPGYWLRADKKSCHDVNECRRANGGCEHICTNTVGSYMCSCRSGYKLDFDRARCLDVDECLQRKPCDPVNGLCQNVPGSYKCKCNMGYSLIENNKCQDVNECNGVNKCQQICRNTVGSYYCDCRKGYVLSQDNKKCTDFDECKNSLHTCDQVCINMVGTYRCQCNLGFRLQSDKKTCQAIRCKSLKAPRYGQLQCTGNTFGERCKYTCDDGYQLAGNRLRTCQISSRWTGIIAKCIAKPCPKIRPPINGILQLPCVEEYKSVCSLKCKRGFILRGNEDIQCGIRDGRVTWINSNSTCQESKICQPNPCKNSGICKLQASSRYECDCSGTGFIGENCEIGVVSISLFPPLVYDKPTDWLEVHGKPEKQLIITPQALNGDVTFIPKRIEIRSPLTKAKFKLIPKSSGLIKIRYSLSGASGKQFSPIADRLVFVASSVPSEEISQIPNVDFTSKQCHTIELDKCPNKQKIELVSSCPWKSSGTSGYQSVSIDKLQIPLSLGGIMSYPMYSRKGALTVSRELNGVLKAGPTFCSSKEACKHGNYTAAEHSFLIKQNLFARSTLKALSSLIPNWIRVNVLYGYNGFHLSNLQSIILKSHHIKQLAICQNKPVQFLPSVYAVQLLFMPVTLHTHGFKETIESSFPTCVLTDICRRIVYFSFPKDKRIDLTPYLRYVGVKSMQLQILGLGFGRGLSSKPECIKINDGSKWCIDSNIWLRASFNVKNDFFNVIGNGEISLFSADLDIAGHDRLAKPLYYIYRGEVKAFISIKAGGKVIRFDIEDKESISYGAFGVPSSRQQESKVYGLNLATKPQISTLQRTSIVSFHPEAKGKFRARLLYGLFGGMVDGIKNKAATLSILRRMNISLQRILSSIVRKLRRIGSFYKTELEGLFNFIKTSKTVLGKTIKMLSSPTTGYNIVYESLFAVINLARSGNDIVELLVTRVSSLQDSQKRIVLSQLKVLKRSLQVARKLQLIPKTKPITETFSGVIIQYSGKLCFQALCFDNLDVSIDSQNRKETSEKILAITATFRENVTISGHFKVIQGAKLEGTVSEVNDEFTIRIGITTTILSTSISTILEINQNKVRIALPAFKMLSDFEFEIEVKADISKASTWQNIHFTITGSASRESDISRTIENQMASYIKATKEMIEERRLNASSLISNVTNAIKIMELERNSKLKVLKKVEMRYEKMKSQYATALTNLDTSLITFRSYQVTEFFKDIEKQFTRLYPFIKCNQSCLAIPIYCICQESVNIDVNTLACQLADRKTTTTVERSMKTQCPITEYRFTPYYTGTCKRGKSGRLSGALGAIGAGVGGLLGGPVGAVVGGFIGGIFGGLFSSCSETYEVYKEVINRQVDCSLRTFKPVTKQWKEAVCSNVTKNVKSGYGNPSECGCANNGTCVIVQDPVCAQDNIRNIARRRIYARQQMDSAGKYNDSFDKVHEAEENARSMLPKVIISEKQYLAAKRNYEKVEAKLKQAKLEIKLANIGIVNFEERFALERCLSRSGGTSKPVIVKQVTFDADPRSGEEILMRVILEKTKTGDLAEQAFIVNLGDMEVSLANGIKTLAHATFCSRKLRRRRSLDNVVLEQERALFVQDSVSIPKNLTNADKVCLVSNTIFSFLQKAVHDLSKKLNDFVEKRDHIRRSLEEVESKLIQSVNAELKGQGNLLSTLMTQLKADMEEYTVPKLYNEWSANMEITTGAANFTKCLNFMDCMKESFRQLKELPNVAKNKTSNFRSSIYEMESASLSLAFHESVYEFSNAVSKIQSELRKIMDLSAFCSKVPRVKLDKPSKLVTVRGNDVVIRCLVQSDIKPVQYAWVFNNVTMLSENDDSLHLKVAKNTQGTYKCVASNSIGSNSSEETFIVVRDKPKLAKEPADFRYYSSIPIEVIPYFACNVTSDPPAAISWYYQPFASNSLVLINNKNPVLKFEKPNTSNAGFYQCIAENPFGAVKSRKARLDVLKSKLPSQRVSLSFDIPLGRSGKIDRISIKRKVISDGELSSKQNVNVSYEFQSGRDVKVHISVIDMEHESDQKSELREVEMLREIMRSRKGLRTSVEKVINGLKKNRGRSIVDSLEKSMRLDFNGELCGSGYYMHENGFTCLQCHVGSYEVNGICHPCSIGSYQDRAGQAFCHLCNANDVTKQVGSINKQQCVKPELRSTDIIFALDSSNSIRRHNWVKVKSFVRKFIEEFFNDQSDLRVGVITYNNFVRVRIPLKYHGKEALKATIDKLPYLGGLTMTYLGIIRAGNEFQKNFVKGRKRILFVMTDGQSTTVGRVPGFALSRRVAMRIQDTGVQVISIGVGDKVDPDELKAIASFPKADNVIQYNNFDQLVSASRRLTAMSLRGQCINPLKDIAVVVEASSSITDRKWRKVQGFLLHFLRRLSSGTHKISLSTFDSKIHMKYPFQTINSEKAISDMISKIVRNKAEKSSSYMEIAEHSYNHIFTEKKGSLSQQKFLVMIILKPFDLRLLNDIQRSYPEEKITLLTVLMNLKKDGEDDGISFGFEDETSFTLANVSQLTKRIEAENHSKARCRSDV